MQYIFCCMYNILQADPRMRSGPWRVRDTADGWWKQWYWATSVGQWCTVYKAGIEWNSRCSDRYSTKAWVGGLCARYGRDETHRAEKPENHASESNSDETRRSEGE